MEKEGYEVWSFIIPACSVNAPHRRDRVWFVAHNRYKNVQRYRSSAINRENKRIQSWKPFSRREWQTNWKQVASTTCVRRVDDGIPDWMDRVRISKAKQRTERLKMLGNAIVPQVAVEIMKTIKEIDENQIISQ
jgi:DNA (cytosine-5)-methyltransferase 1